MKPRRASVKLIYKEKDITSDIEADVESISHEGNAADSSDSLSVTINAMADKWLDDWMPTKGTTLDGTIFTHDWPEEGQEGQMNGGVMTVDNIGYSGAPGTMTISATSKPNDTSFSEEDREFIWKNTSIQKIAQTIAGRYSLELGFDGKDAEIVKREQKATDSSFLDDLCKDYGLILKAYSKKLWIYDREAYKKKKVAATIDRTDIVPGSFNFNDGFDGTYTHGIWEYSNQKKKIKIRAEIGKSGRTKRISKYASSQADAERRLQAALDNANHGSTKIKFKLALAQIELCESQNVNVTGYGKLSGKYFIDKVTLEYSRSGLEQTLECSWVSALEESESNGKAVTLQNAPLYYTSVDKKPVRTVSGKYYLYDGVAVAGRYRITNLASRCGKTPVGKNVTGWVDAKDIRSVT
jgi:phage protein D